MFPETIVTLEDVRSFVRDCPICQKYRSANQPTLPAITKTLNAPHARSVIACDTLSVTSDSLGNRYILVVINLFTRFVHLFPVAEKDTRTTATCIFQFYAYYGLCDIFHSDPGSDFMSAVVKHLLTWLGVGRTVTLVNNPQANGVERANREVLRHLQTIVADERVKTSWSDPTVISWIQLIMNSFTHSGTGYSPFTLTYGNLDHSSFEFPIIAPQMADEFCTQLSDNMKVIRSISSEYQSTLKSSRRASSDPIAQTRYEAGDFVFYLLADKLLRGNKLNSLKKGPYLVVTHPANSNVVSVRNLISDAIHEFNQKDLQVFRGTADEAAQLAELDDDQHAVDHIVGYSGDPEKRTTLQFYVLFKDGDKLWLDYSPDLSMTAAFEAYCSGIPCLRIVLLKHDMVKSL